MNNRICPSEELLSAYLTGCLDPELRKHTEKHLGVCAGCRRLIAETYEVSRKDRAREKNKELFGRIKKDMWLVGACVSFALSFLFPKYFAQFLVACFIMGAKWIIDSKATKLLITVHEAWKRGDQNEGITNNQDTRYKK